MWLYAKVFSAKFGAWRLFSAKVFFLESLCNSPSACLPHFWGNLTHFCLLSHSNEVHGLDRSAVYHCILSLLSMVRLPRLNAVVKSDGAQYRAGASHFRLVRPLRCEEARGVWGHVPPGTLRSLLRPCSGQNATRITPPVVSVAIEPSCQKYLHARRAC